MANSFETLEGKFGKVEEIQKELVPAEAELETTRSRVWKLLGAEPFGAVHIGGFRFSRLMLVIGAAFTAGMTFMFVAPVLGLLAAMCVAAAGVVWIKANLA